MPVTPGTVHPHAVCLCIIEVIQGCMLLRVMLENPDEIWVVGPQLQRARRGRSERCLLVTVFYCVLPSTTTRIVL